MGNIIINGTITTVSPLSICMPDPQPEFGGFPIMARGVDEDGNKLQTGYLPATTVRGFIRRAIVTADMRQAAEDGKPYDLPRAYDELVGQNADSEKQAGETDLLAIKETRENSPVLDLFQEEFSDDRGVVLPNFVILQSEFKCALNPCREFVCHLRFDAKNCGNDSGRDLTCVLLCNVSRSFFNEFTD